MSKVSIQENGCWHWTASLRNGYGALKLNKKVQSTHRISYELFVGEIPENMLVCHKCDVRHCVNPKHLFIGTHRDNSVDAYQKGRIVVPTSGQFGSGEKHRMSKLKQKDVDEIKQKYKLPKNTLRLLAKEYKVDHSLIWQIVNNKTCWN